MMDICENRDIKQTQEGLKGQPSHTQDTKHRF